MPGMHALASPIEKTSNKKVPENLKKELIEKEKKVEDIKKKQEELRKDLQEITQQYQDSYTKLLLVKERAKRNQQNLDEASIELELNQSKLNDRVVGMYKNRDDLVILSLIFDFESFDAIISKFQFLHLISKADSDLIEKTKSLKEEIEEKQHALDKIKINHQEALSEVEKKQNDMKRNLDAQNMLAKLISQDIVRLRKRTTNLDGLELSIVFPLDGPHSFINDWGFPRSGGRRHRGNDIFAQIGTPVVAVTDGVIGKASHVERGLGGITLWVYGYDNNQYYFAHLSEIHPGIKVGIRVKTGQVIGYVGDTGNARTTPPHLHFQVHPGGGEPINPYQYLVAVDPYQ